MSALLKVLELQSADTDVWAGRGYGPPGKRAFGGQFLAQSLAAAAASLPLADDIAPTSLHLQFLRTGDAVEPTEYAVERTHDGRTAMTRRVVARQAGKILTTATVSFSRAMAGPEHGVREDLPHDPEQLDRTGPPGPAPGLPLDELDIRIADEGAGADFVRRMWWRATVPMPDDALLHTCAMLFVTDVYMIDPALRVHGHSMQARTHRSGTLDAAVWFHRRIRADRWNLVESRSPAASRGRGLVSAGLIGADGGICATIVQEGLIASRDTASTTTN
ncbi:acyl-CoA thioesterase [[Mycobacterium] wendilense]|uniref:Thioesterase family protein n=1 Tax=[Mycobacterium] wendilense TaxID=3064284 RepID=A0ABN9P478_9MYCO|nr:acyl-CoA thioesterase domain-containing protein [Mycolicibacterium sp. MU0050]CAJ1586696.1 thioesterase family protein [Mycolicibacterium sp. MU0050]